MVNAEGSELDTIVDANPGHFFTYGFHADLSPDGSRLVYSSCEYPTGEVDMSAADQRSERRKYHYEIATVALAGPDPRRLTVNSSIDHHPVWSPDMTRVAFLFGHSNAPDRLRVMWADGSNQQDVTAMNSASWLPPPLWSPEGEHLAFFDYEDASSDRSIEWPYRFPLTLHTVRIDGTGLSRISEHTGAASWSPDGRRIAVARVAGEDVVLETIAPDGSDSRRIIEITDRETSFADYYVRGRFGWGFLGSLSWSPDGTHILYVCEAGVCVTDLDGNLVGESPADLIPHEGRPHAAWSPDGSRIAIRSPGQPYTNPHADGSAALFTMARDGTDVRVLVRGGPPGGPPLVLENAQDE